MSDSWLTVFGATFALVFVAELGDKTQLAALGLASTGQQPWAVFAGSALALTLASALAVGVGRLLSERIDPAWLHYVGATLFLLIAVVMFVRGPERAPQPTPQDSQSSEASPDSPH